MTIRRSWQKEHGNENENENPDAFYHDESHEEPP